MKPKKISCHFYLEQSLMDSYRKHCSKHGYSQSNRMSWIITDYLEMCRKEESLKQLMKRMEGDKK